jgi:hypothetical protein
MIQPYFLLEDMMKAGSIRRDCVVGSVVILTRRSIGAEREMILLVRGLQLAREVVPEFKRPASS